MLCTCYAIPLVDLNRKKIRSRLFLLEYLREENVHWQCMKWYCTASFKLGYVRKPYEVHFDRDACPISSSSPVEPMEPMIFIKESKLLRSITFK